MFVTKSSVSSLVATALCAALVFIATTPSAAVPGIVRAIVPTVESTTTTTTTSTTTSTSLEAPTSSSTTLPPGVPCEVEFVLSDAVTVGSLGWEVDYAAADGEFSTDPGGALECTILAPALVLLSANPGTKTLLGSLISLGQLTGPTSLARCGFLAESAPQPSDFLLEVIDAADANSDPIAPLPLVTVALTCETTPTSTTSTTMTTGTTVTTLTSTTTSTLPAGDLCSVVFRLDDAIALGSLQFEADASAAAGHFPSSNGAPNCTNHLPASLPAFALRGDTGEKVLEAAIIALTPFSGPTDIVTCDYLAEGPVVDADLIVTVIDAADEDAGAVDPFPSMSARFVGCGDVCGNGLVEFEEQCDDGDGNSDTVPDACRSDCSEPVCGDGVIDPGFDEECDDGASNSDVAADTCRTDCALPSCGDAVTDSAEECDDGNTAGEDGCSGTCERRCGDINLDGNITAPDALRILLATIDSELECPLFICDTNNDGVVLATDALLALLASVNLAELSCP